MNKKKLAAIICGATLAAGSLVYAIREPIKDISWEIAKYMFYDEDIPTDENYNRVRTIYDPQIRENSYSYNPQNGRFEREVIRNYNGTSNREIEVFSSNR